MNRYNDTLRYLYGLEKFGIVFGLENITWILNLIGNPHKSFKCIHIGGTNGKGSVASMLSNIFMEGGYRTGKYTSPHLCHSQNALR
jgi:dihydrofolate synthase/folylpolyglutamate synthase